MIARSGRPEALIPAEAPPARNPAGIAAWRSTGGRSVGSAESGSWSVAGAGRSVSVVGTSSSRHQRELLEAGGLGQAVDEVERLDRLAGGALDEVVEHADREDAAGPRVDVGRGPGRGCCR